MDLNCYLIVIPDDNSFSPYYTMSCPNVALVIKPNANEMSMQRKLFYLYYTLFNQFGVLSTDDENYFLNIPSSCQRKKCLNIPQRKIPCVFFKSASQKRSVKEALNSRVSAAP